MSILQENLTDYQLLSEQDQREWLSKVINVVTCSKRGFKVLNRWLEAEIEYCNQHHISLPILN